jgi:hypothetical protein
MDVARIPSIIIENDIGQPHNPSYYLQFGTFG